VKALLASAAAMIPGFAAACPVCARDDAPITLLLVAGMIAAPYLVAVVVIRAIRETDSRP
jgi:hypothetical protein